MWDNNIKSRQLIALPNTQTLSGSNWNIVQSVIATSHQYVYDFIFIAPSWTLLSSCRLWSYRYHYRYYRWQGPIFQLSQLHTQLRGNETHPKEGKSTCFFTFFSFLQFFLNVFGTIMNAIVVVSSLIIAVAIIAAIPGDKAPYFNYRSCRNGCNHCVVRKFV